MKKAILISFAVTLLVGIFAVPVAKAQAAANFDSWGNEGIKILQVGNSTDSAGSTNWQNNTVNADSGETIALLVHYHNFTNGETANNTRVSVNIPSGSASTHSISVNVWADNSSVYSDSVTAYLSSAQSLTFTSGSVVWYPKGQSATQLPSGQSGNEINTVSGVNIGDVEDGDSESGYIVLKIQVSGGSTGGNIPTATTNSATNIGQYNADLNGSVNPNGNNTNAWFEYGTSYGSLSNTTSQTTIGSGNSSIDFSRYVSTLSYNTTYYYRAVAQNSYGTSYGSTLSFTTGSGGGGNIPTATTNSATNIGQYNADLNGSVNPNGNNTNAWFEYGTSYGSLGNTTSQTTIGSGSSSVDFSRYVSTLSYNTTYYYRAVAQNSYGTSYGSTLSFTTGSGGGGGCVPVVTTNIATFITKNSASLRGLINPNNRYTSGWFEYGTSYALGNKTDTQYVSSGSSNVDIIGYIPSLNQNTTYYFRTVGENNCGRSYGTILSFTTENDSGSLPIANTLSASSIAQTSALLRGDVNPKNVSATAWFEYGTNSSLTYYSITTSSSVGTGDYLRSVSAVPLSLSADTTYYYRVVAQNSYGTTKGAIFSFRTLSGYTPAPAPTTSFSVWKETKNLSFPNGTEYINAAFIGDTIEYSLNIKNKGSITLNDVVVRDSLSSHFDYLESNPNISSDSSGNSLVWRIGSISAGDTKTITLKVKARTVNESVVVYNSFSAQANGITKTTEKTTTILNPTLMAIDITVDKSSVRKNEGLGYTIRYRNIGVADIDNAVVKVVLPKNLTIDSTNPNFYSSDENVIFFNIGRVNKNEANSISINARVSDSAEVGEELITTAVLDFTDTFGDPQPNVSVSVMSSVGSGLFSAASAAGFAIGDGNVWFYLFLALAAFLIGFVVYIRYKISRLLQA